MAGGDEMVSTAVSGDVRGCPFGEGWGAADERPGDASVDCPYRMLARSAAASPAADCLGWRARRAPGAPAPVPGGPPDETRPYTWWSYADVLAKATGVGKGLVEKFGLVKGDTVGVYAKNCPWWSVSMYACNSQGLVIVPIYDTLGPNIVEYVCSHAEVKVVLVSPENAGKLETAIGKCETVQGVVLIEDCADEAPTDASRAAAAQPGVAAKAPCMMADVVAAGAGASTPADASPAGWDEKYCIMYTSGTTGNPKGVSLKNSNVVSSVASAYKYFSKYAAPFTNADTILSYLPLSHIFEQQAQAIFAGCGGRVGFYTGDIKLLLDDLTALKPTVFIGVPRVFARFQERILGNVESASIIVKTLFRMGYDRQLRAVQSPAGPNKVERSGLWDTLVFKKVRGKLLPNVRLVITGSAPMSAQTNDFLKVCLMCPVIQGYGLTETVGGVVTSAPGVSKSGHCGGPLPGVHVKLGDLPEMGYLNADKPYPRGEICLKGSFLFPGYYKNEKATSEVMDSEGFFKTGDVGQWLPDGSLQIIDRAKNLFKLSQGEYVSPEQIEGELVKAKLVGQIYVYGNSLQSTLVAVVVPDIPASKAWCEANAKDVGASSIEAIGAHAPFKAALIEQLASVAAVAKLKKYEYIKDCIIETGDLNELGQGFHVDNNLMTPSFKLRRPQLSAKYKATLEALYN